jgi:hypothetical protein
MSNHGESRIFQLAIIGGIGYAIAGLNGLVPFPDFEGGRSDPAPRGAIIYKGQTAEAISDRLLIDIGDGTAQVAVKARQNWDHNGTIVNGDWQGTNGTSSVRDPKNHDDPATLPVDIDYCSEGYVEVEKSGENVKSVVYHLGSLGVCDAHLDFGKEEVSSAFNQDDTPDDFDGEFVSFITNGVEETALAAPCPVEELQKYQTPQALQHFQEILAARFGVDVAAVTVEEGTIAATDPEDQVVLTAELNSFANKQDPKDPAKTYPALDISFLTANASAVENSCYMSSGGTKLSDLVSADIEFKDQVTPTPGN